ncbi:ATP-binding protein [Nannocystis pusilla]|uniref:ATP-binding protein n=1 Tax=Nannocystis pusilla TaxID=889268 RepID=UPI003B7A564C
MWFVDFAPLKLGALVPHAIAAATGLVVHSANVMTALTRFLRDRRTLLVLDSCEHLVDEIASCVSQILRGAPLVHTLVTSRTPLRVAGEQTRRLPGLGVPPSAENLSAKEALTFSAIELFVERATERHESFVLGDAEAPAVADICRKLDGIALALELAAMRIDVFGVEGLRKQLDDRLRLLGARRAGTERHRTLAATLDWSYGLLPAHEASVLRAVSVFAGAFRPSDAAAIAALPTRAAAVILGELAAQSLLSVDGEADSREVLYRLLETTRAYGLEKLVASGEDQIARLRHAEHVRDVVGVAAGSSHHFRHGNGEPLTVATSAICVVPWHGPPRYLGKPRCSWSSPPPAPCYGITSR